MRIAHFGWALFLGLASSIVVSAETVHASLPLDTQTSQLALSVTLNGKSIASASVPFSGGTFNADITQTGAAPPSLSLANVAGSVDAGSFDIQTVLGNISVSGLALSFGPDAGPFLSSGLDPAHLNFAGLPVSIDQGAIDVGRTTIANFARTPLDFKVSSTNATLSNGELFLTDPVRASGTESFTILGLHETLAYTLTGSINFAGAVPVSVPEPSTLVLAACGGLALLAHRRRRQSR